MRRSDHHQIALRRDPAVQNIPNVAEQSSGVWLWTRGEAFVQTVTLSTLSTECSAAMVLQSSNSIR
jgi:hypothetical protein